MSYKLIHLTFLLTLSLCSHGLVANDSIKTHENSLTHDSLKDNRESYEGYWSFVREDFKKRHRFWPSWMISKAMKTRLYLSQDFFIQYSNPNETYKEPRPMKEVIPHEDQGWKFIREESNAEISFTLKKEGDVWIYRENEKVYQLVKNSPEEVNRWKQDS